MRTRSHPDCCTSGAGLPSNGRWRSKARYTCYRPRTSGSSSASWNGWSNIGPGLGELAAAPIARGRLWGALHTPGPSTAGIMGTSVSATPRAVCRRLQSGREGRPHGEPLEAELATRDLVIRVAGEAGEGVLSTGQLITQAAARAGFG